MIERFYLKDYLSFKEVDLEFESGLILFSGASGTGKSILLDAMLGVFALKELKEASLVELSVDNQLDMDKYGIENDEPNIFRFVKGKSARYFINHNQISKKSIKKISSGIIDYLSLKEYKEFKNSRILEVLDEIISKNDKSYKKILKDYKNFFEQFKKVASELKKIENEERKIEELKEFAVYEIEKIEEISPKIGEYDKLVSIKKALSKKEKILETIQNAKLIFDYEHFVNEALILLEIDNSFFNDSLYELRVHFENATEKLNELDEDEIEGILNRIEKLSSLKQRYGSISKTLEYLEKKKKEVRRYENIAYEKDELKQLYETLDKECIVLADKISKSRQKAIEKLNKMINSYLKMLYLDEINLSIKTKNLEIDGKDEIDINLWGVELNKISTGEFNRVRLAFLSSFNDILNKNLNGILILDEVDANLSGKESMSIAKVLEKLSKNYQIFAISHQPQLTSRAKIHFLVYKEKGISRVKELKTDRAKTDELARMISGEKIGEEAIDFAKSLRRER